MQAALRVALHRAEDDGQLDPVLDGALSATALDLAAGLDGLTATADAYGHARLAKLLLECLRELGLTPPSRHTDLDGLTAFIQSLQEPERTAPMD